MMEEQKRQEELQALKQTSLIPELSVLHSGFREDDKMRMSRR
jgi:hypothetical protein